MVRKKEQNVNENKILENMGLASRNDFGSP